MADGRDESWSEITIRPDGRVYVFGLTRPLLAVLAELPAREDQWQTLLESADADLHNQIEPTAPQ